jgi:hypothetical protein
MRPIALDIGAALGAPLDAGPLLIRISGVPQDAALSAGIKGANGVWLLSQEELVGLTLTRAADQERELELRVRTIAFEGETSGYTRVMQKLKLTVPAIQ